MITSNEMMRGYSENGIFSDLLLNRLEYKDTRFYPCVEKQYEGIYVPSATTILDVVPKGKAYKNWLQDLGQEADYISASAMEKGSTVHNLTERFDNGEEIHLADENGKIRFSLQEVEMFNKYVEFSERYKPFIIANEWGVGSAELRFGGMLDRVFKIDGENWLIDIKTGNMYSTYWRQVASYKVLWEHFNPQFKIDRIGILHLNAQSRTDGKLQGRGWKIEEMPTDEVGADGKRGFELYWHLFKMSLHEWYYQNPNATPKNRVFKLNFKKDW